MWKTDKIATIMLLLLLCGLTFGLYTLFVLRFETGDMFPAYSSMRADPLGVKGLYQALESISGISTDRHYRDLSKISGTEGRTLFYLGLRPDFLISTPPGLVDQMETLAKTGVRIVLAFQSGSRKSSGEFRDAWPGKFKGKPPKGSEELPIERKDNDGGKSEPRSAVSEKWGVNPSSAPVCKTGKDTPAHALLKDPVDGLPASVLLHTGLRFENPGPAWRILYAVETQPVIIERSFGAGNIVMVADSYLFSNEAMFRGPSAALLSWCVGRSHLVVFDEFHLGVRDRPGVMGLIRKYRLQGFLAGLILLAGLFAWQNAIPFNALRNAPKPGEGKEVSGNDQFNGLINLLRRNIDPGSVLKTCFEEWEKSAHRHSSVIRDKVNYVWDLIEAEQGKPVCSKGIVAVYREIAQVLSDAKSGRGAG